MEPKRMAAQLMTDEIRRKPGRPKRTITTKPTDKQAHILKTHQEHLDLTVREVAAICDTSHSHVIATLQRYGIQKERVDNFKKHRGDILAGLQERMINSVTDKDIKQATMLQRVTATAILYDKERLERDLSTSNIASVHADVAAMKALSMGTPMGTCVKKDDEDK
jgi:hypothetical protein